MGGSRIHSHGGIDIPGRFPRHKDNRNSDRFRRKHADAPKLESVGERHINVQDNQVDGMRPDLMQRRLAIVSTGDLVSFKLQIFFKR